MPSGALVSPREASAMSDFAFKVNLVAVVRVLADDQSAARKVVLRSLERPAPLKSDWPMRTMPRGAVPQR